jgi:hypothetical protein
MQKLSTQSFPMRALLVTILLLFAGCTHKTSAPATPPPAPQSSAQKPPLLYLRAPKELNLSALLQRTRHLPHPQRLAAISEAFLGIPYGPVRRADYPPQKGLIAQLDKMDCMCLVEYAEALARSNDLKEFPRQLLRVRYKNDTISYQTKRHFFSQWLENGYKDVGNTISPYARKICKHLNYNQKLPGIEPFFVCLWVVPAKDADLSRFRTGDILGIYAYRPDQAWLDVTHMGIVVYKDGLPYFRNASSKMRYKKMVDIPLDEYLETIPFVIVLRKSR